MRRKPQKLRVPRAVADILEKTLDQHVAEPMPQNIPEGAHPIGRLCTLSQGPFVADPADIAASLNFKRGGAFFCDSTMFLSETASEIWSALMHDRRIVLVAPMIQELERWLRDPRGTNIGAHTEISAALAGKPTDAVRLVDPPPDRMLRTAGNYYFNLLSRRKHSLELSQHWLEKKLGRVPSAQEVSNYCQQTLTSRGQLLGRQGLEPKVRAHLYNDERLVVSAIFHAICSGEEVTLLTSDEAVFDQFWKALNLIHGHYFSMSFADLYVKNAGAYSDKAEKYGERGVFVNDDVIIVQKPHPLSYDLLPPPTREVQIHCMLLQRAWSRITYCAEIGMRRLLRIKGQTRGLNTCRLNGRNCHWYMTVKGIRQFGDAIAIGEDVIVPDQPVRLCPVDLELTLESYLNPIPIKYVQPSNVG
jgi:hypothetical protein